MNQKLNNSQEHPTVNRQYKDRLFRMVFSRKEDLLSLYNAITGTSYSNPDDLEVATLENALYLSMKNDMAFLLDVVLNLYEHQSTINYPGASTQALCSAPTSPLTALAFLSCSRKIESGV